MTTRNKSPDGEKIMLTVKQAKFMALANTLLDVGLKRMLSP